MKRIFLSGLVITALAFTSCERFLDVRQPDVIPYDKALEKLDNVEALTRGAYADYQGVTGFMVSATMFGDEVDLARQANDQFGADYLTGNFGIFNGIGESLWGNGYTAIHKSNQLIDAYERSLYTTNEATRNRLGGEAYFIRGYMHFELCRLFALPYSAGKNRAGIVIRNTASAFADDEVNNKPGRATIEQSYNQAVNDLKRAIELLPDNPAIGRLGKDAARAALARVYFNMDENGITTNYQEATTLCNQIIASGKYKMTAAKAPFSVSGISRADSGVLFQLVNTISDAAGGDLAGAFWGNSANNVFTPIRTGSGSLFNELRDNAGSRFDSLVLGQASGRPYTAKWVGANVPFNNVPLFRYAEVLLTRAEANILAGGDINQSLADLNAVRTNYNLPALTSTDQATVLAEIRRERRIELHLEGDRYHQLRRLRLPIRGNAFDDPTKIFKIPNSEIRANPTMEQNG